MESQNLEGLLSAASPSTVAVTASVVTSTTVSSLLNMAPKTEIKTETSSEGAKVKQEVEVKEEKMDTKPDTAVKTESDSVKAENSSSSPKRENMDETSQASTDEQPGSVGDSSNNATALTPKPRCKKGDYFYSFSETGGGGDIILM